MSSPTPNGFSSTWDLCSQPLYPQFFPRPCLAKSVCLHWPVSVFRMCPSSVLLSFCKLFPYRARYQESLPCTKPEFPQRSLEVAVPLQQLWQLSFSKFPPGGAGAWEGFLFWGSLIGLEWSKDTNTKSPTSPVTEKKKASKGGGRDKVAGLGRCLLLESSKGGLGGGRPFHTHLTCAHIEQVRCCNMGGAWFGELPPTP